MPHTVAVVILTYNEELNIQDCLALYRRMG